MQEIAVLGIQEDRPEVLLVVIVVPQKVASELRYCRGAAQGPRRRRAGLPDHRPRCELEDRKSTRLNSSHLVISYAVFCLKKKKKLQPATNARQNVASTDP